MRLTIEKFQQLYAISTMQLDDLEKSSRLVQCLTGKSEMEIDSMNIVKYNLLCKKVGKIFDMKARRMSLGKPKDTIKVNGRYYRLILSVKPPFNAGKYVEVLTFKDDVIGNLHKIMASIAIPLRWSWKQFKFVPMEADHESIADEMLDANFDAAYHAAVFFYAVLTHSIKDLEFFLKKEIVKKGIPIMEAEKVLTSLHSTLDGFIQPRWLRTLNAAK